MKIIIRTLLAAGLAIAATAPITAHHSFSMFNTTEQTTITGVVKQFDWTNPHTFTWVDVTGADGKVTTWGLEGMSPNYLGRRGWSKRTLKPGDKITVTINALKDGQPGGMFLRCKLADGTDMVMFGNAPSGKQ